MVLDYKRYSSLLGPEGIVTNRRIDAKESEVALIRFYYTA